MSTSSVVALAGAILEVGRRVAVDIPDALTMAAQMNALADNEQAMAVEAEQVSSSSCITYHRVTPESSHRA